MGGGRATKYHKRLFVSAAISVSLSPWIWLRILNERVNRTGLVCAAAVAAA